jgi:hypothetical protein
VAARIAAGRKRREIDPAVDALRACVSDTDDPTISPVASKRLKEMPGFTELVAAGIRRCSTCRGRG